MEKSMENRIQATISYIFGKYDVRKGVEGRVRMENVFNVCMRDIESHPALVVALDSQEKIEFFVMQTIIYMITVNKLNAEDFQVYEKQKDDKLEIKGIVIPVSILNSIFKSAGSDLQIFYKKDECGMCKISSKSDQNKPHTVIAGEILGIRVRDWEWTEDGLSVIIRYVEN